jgi:hypothetical protein
VVSVTDPYGRILGFLDQDDHLSRQNMSAQRNRLVLPVRHQDYNPGTPVCNVLCSATFTVENTAKGILVTQKQSALRYCQPPSLLSYSDNLKVLVY